MKQPLKHSADVHRLLKILTLLQSGGTHNPDNLAIALDVSKRTVYRDINKLQSTGVPIEFDDTTQSYRVGPGFFLPPLQLTGDEALALAVLCDEVAQKEQIAFLGPAFRALAKIEAQLPPEIREELSAMAGHLVVRTAQSDPSSGAVDVYERMRHAIAARTALECQYETPSEGPGIEPRDPEPFLFEPYALLFSVRAWYAIGRHARRDAVRCLKLSRFIQVVPTEHRYTIPTDFSVESHLGNAWRLIKGAKEHEVVLRFDPPIGETVADTLWHPTQVVEHNQDGSIVLRFTVAGLDEIVWWILSMGPSCRVVEPPSLIERVRELATRTAALYTEQTPAPSSGRSTRRA